MLALTRMVARVFWQFDDKVFLRHDGLARQARLRGQAPRHVQQVFFLVFNLIERVVTLAHDDVAGGAGADFFAGVLNMHAVLQ